MTIGYGSRQAAAGRSVKYTIPTQHRAEQPARSDGHSRHDEETGGGLMAVATDLDGRCIDTVRMLCVDAIEVARSGHPGTPLGIAPVTYTLWQPFLRFDPWYRSGRTVIASSSLLDMRPCCSAAPSPLGRPSRRSRLRGPRPARCLPRRPPEVPPARLEVPRPPRYHGRAASRPLRPLGQGVATSVGMALAGQWLAARYNGDGFTIFDFDVYAQAGDGCMMEGVSSEAASYAAHQQLFSNLCWIYDSNRVTIEGHTDFTLSEDVAARFTAYGWNVTTVADANELEQVQRALHTFRAEHDRPTLVVVHSHIGYGTPVEDTPKAHGAPLGPDGVRAAKRSTARRRTRSSSYPTAFTSTSPRASGHAAGRPARSGRPDRGVPRSPADARGRDRADAAARVAG